jgi:hypothetical protein
LTETDTDTGRDHDRRNHAELDSRDHHVR